MTTTEPQMTNHNVVSRAEWLEVRRQHLLEEKRLTRELDQLRRQRCELPWVRVEKEYVFDTPVGKQTLADLFDGRSQLIVYHFMFGPGWKEGCDGCSFLADHFDGVNLHLPHHDVTLLAVSRAPLAEFEPFRHRMGWRFRWVSSHGSDFNYDYDVSYTDEQVAAGETYYNYKKIETRGGEHHGISVFYKDDAGDIFHTYSSYARGGDLLLGTHNFLDLTPKGRNEEGPMSWVRHHDRYTA